MNRWMNDSGSLKLTWWDEQKATGMSLMQECVNNTGGVCH